MGSPPAPDSVWALVLSAGRGDRMGGLKHLLPVAGVPMLLCVVRALRGSRVRGVTVVLRAGDLAAADLVKGEGARVAFAEDPDEGRAASIRAGVAAAPAGAEALLFAMADQPFLQPADFNLVIDGFARSPGAILYARYARSRGTPVLFAARYRPELALLRGDQGGRDLIALHPEEARPIELDAARGRDLDRPADLPGTFER